jgi:recombinational DNA repair protein RecR
VNPPSTFTGVNPVWEGLRVPRLAISVACVRCQPCARILKLKLHVRQLKVSVIDSRNVLYLCQICLNSGESALCQICLNSGESALCQICLNSGESALCQICLNSGESALCQICLNSGESALCQICLNSGESALCSSTMCNESKIPSFLVMIIQNSAGAL